MARFFMSSIPKSGTHFMIEFYHKLNLKSHEVEDEQYRLLIQQLYRPQGKTDYHNPELKALRDPIIKAILEMPENHYVYNHYPYDPILLQDLVDAQLPIVFLIRDPRDYVVSLTNHILRRSDHKHHLRFQHMKSDEERFLAVIKGAKRTEKFKGVLAMKFMYEKMSGWLEAERVLTLRFEEVIGPKGGGSRQVQYVTFEKLLNHIHFPLDGDDLYSQIDDSYNENANLFVKGQIGQWREVFSEKVLACFYKHADYILDLLGYTEKSKLPHQLKNCVDAVSPDGESSSIPPFVRGGKGEIEEAERGFSTSKSAQNIKDKEMKMLRLCLERSEGNLIKEYEQNKKQTEKITQLQERIAWLEKESEERLTEIQQRDETISQLKEEIENLKEQINPSLGQKILRKIKTTFEE